MTQDRERKDELRINWKAFTIIAVVLVSVHIWGMLGGYDWISEISPIYNEREFPVGMANPTFSKQCSETLEELMTLKNFLGIGDVLTQEQIEEIAWLDYEHLVKLELRLAELNCSLEPDT
jgi:hypothetical protein